jgi:hypothetical protein
MSEQKTKPGTVTPQDEHASSEPAEIKDEQASGGLVTPNDEHASGEPV